MKDRGVGLFEVINAGYKNEFCVAEADPERFSPVAGERQASVLRGAY